MQEFTAVLGNAVTGLFALLAAFFAWRLKKTGDEKERETSLAIEKHRELSELYAQVFSTLEQAMKCTMSHEPFELTEARSRDNAKVRLLGSEEVNLAYDDASDKLQNWSALHVAASPQRTRIGDQTFITIQAPDPTEKYKAPAEAAHKALHEALQVLRVRMRADLSSA
jgi:hypothetical protein